jgi:prepilin-type N-terminal cleavage/methylation domain-containing protein
MRATKSFVGRLTTRCHRTRFVEEDAGFTLTELLLVIVMLGIIVGAIASSMFVSVHAADDVKLRVAESADEQQLAAFFGSDAASAGTVSLAAAGVSCGSALPAGSTNVVRFTWPVATPTNAVDYYVMTSPSRLARRSCAGGSLVSDRVLVQNLQGVPAVTCPPPSPMSNCTGPFPPAVVAMAVTEVNERVGNPLTFRVQGALKTTPSFQTPGSGGDTTALLLFGSDGLTLGGGSLVNVVSGGSVFNYSGATFNGNNSGLNAPGGYGTSQSTCPTGLGTTPCEAGLPPIPDPYASLNASGFPQKVWTTNCPGPDGNCQEGYYTNTIDLQGGQKTVTFTAPGFYWLGQGLDGSSAQATINTVGTGTVYLYTRSTSPSINLNGHVNVDPNTHLVIVAPSLTMSGGVDLTVG